MAHSRKEINRGHIGRAIVGQAKENTDLTRMHMTAKNTRKRLKGSGRRRGRGK
jgi:hypothetical protein